MGKFCIFCGTELPGEAKFCFSCGKAQPAYDGDRRIVQSFEPSADCAKVNKKPAAPLALLRNSLILAVAVILFTLSFFPFIKVEQNMSEQGISFDVEVDFSPIDVVVLFFDSFKMLSEEELENSAIAEELEELQNDVIDEISVSASGKITFSREGERLMKKAAMLTMRQTIQSEDYTPGFFVILNLISCVLYILLTLALLVFAILSFISYFGYLANFKEKALSLSIKLLAGVPGMLLFRYCLYFIYSGVRNTSMAWGSIVSLIVSGAAIVTLIILALTQKTHTRKIHLPFRVISSVLSVFAICMSLLPIMTTTVEAEFSGRADTSEVDIPVYSSFYAGFEYSAMDWDDLEDLKEKNEIQRKAYFREKFGEFEDFTKAQINSGIADYNNIHYLIASTVINQPDALVNLFSCVSLLYFAFFILLSMLLQQNLRCLMDGEYSRIQARIGKIAGVVCAGLILAATTAIIFLIADSLYLYAPTRYSVAFGAGTIFVLVFAIASLVIPGEKKQTITAAVDEPIDTDDTAEPVIN